MNHPSNTEHKTAFGCPEWHAAHAHGCTGGLSASRWVRLPIRFLRTCAAWIVFPFALVAFSIVAIFQHISDHP